MSSSKFWKTLSSELAFDNKWMKVQRDTVQLPNGTILDDYYMYKSSDVIVVIALTPDNKVVLVKQYKHAGDDIFTEAPAGFVNDGEAHLDAAKRELEEETGYTSESFEYLGKLTHNPTKVIETIHAYLATNVQKTTNQHLDENESIEVLLKTPQEVLEMIESGELWVTGSIAAFFKAFRKMGVI